ncbi:MAG TPA: heme ABC exporter ATP-binding protein CcmA [Thermoanaerobaculia bacterium]|nr:heme ABC exporter ATP-binding protein CcmA [Thermoanaerobaculia bacterium]
MIEIDRLGRRYGSRWALSNISVRIRDASVVMVAGPNGSGKSTLFRILATAIRPHCGTATIDGWDLDRHRDDVRKSVALLTHASYLYEPLTGLENLRVFADHLDRSRDGLMPLLERVGLASRANDPVSAYSAGMRKRLSFARVLLQEPRVVMLDEPYGQLDPEGFTLVDEVVRELRERGATVLMATHQLERGTKLADSMLFLEAGRVVRTC